MKWYSYSTERLKSSTKSQGSSSRIRSRRVVDYRDPRCLANLLAKHECLGARGEGQQVETGGAQHRTGAGRQVRTGGAHVRTGAHLTGAHRTGAHRTGAHRTGAQVRRTGAHTRTVGAQTVTGAQTGAQWLITGTLAHTGAQAVAQTGALEHAGAQDGAAEHGAQQAAWAWPPFEPHLPNSKPA